MAFTKCYVCLGLLGVIHCVLAGDGIPTDLCPDIPGFDCAAIICGTHPCLNGGTCKTNGLADIICICSENFTGSLCEFNKTSTTVATTQVTTATTATTTPMTTATTLATMPVTPTTTTMPSAQLTTAATVSAAPHPCSFTPWPCLNGGFCVATGAGSDYDCVCPPGFSGPKCENVPSPAPTATLAVSQCSSNSCKNSGLCVSTGSNDICYCPATHTGVLCETEVATTASLSTTDGPDNNSTQNTTTTVSVVPTITNQPLTTTSPVSSTISYIGCKADIQFLLDASTSIGSIDFQKQLLFVSDLVKSLYENSQDVRVGLATFSSSVNDRFHMDAYTLVGYTVQDIVRDIESTPYRGGTTHTDLALQFARTTSFAAGNGERVATDNIAIIITDGQSFDQAETANQAKLLRQANVNIIAVGVGSGIDRTELDLITGVPGHVYTVSDFTALKNIQTNVLTSTCSVSSG